MATLVRIKRPLEDEPLDALVLNCKKRKINTPENEDKENVPVNLSTVLTFAGTVNQNEDIQQLINSKKLNSDNFYELKSKFKTRQTNLTEKLRAQFEENSKANRFKVVNCFRSLDLSLDPEDKPSSSSSDTGYTVFDIETDLNDNDNHTTDLNNIKTSENKYVYDVYYADSYSDDVGQAILADFDSVSIYPLNEPLVFGSARDNGLDDNNSDYDSDDSNDECNWRNDYPDESDLESINEDDMIKAVNDLDIGRELSSSDEEPFVHTRDEDESLRLDPEEVRRFGKCYATYKARCREMENYDPRDDDFWFDDDAPSWGEADSD